MALHAAALSCKTILTKLQALSDVAAAAIRTEGRLAHGTRSDGLRTRDKHALAARSTRYSDSTLPAGTGSDSGKDRSLYHYYLPRMRTALQTVQNAGTPEEHESSLASVYRLISDAQRDYLAHIGKRDELHFDTETEATRYLLTELRGKSVEEAAAKMRVRNQSMPSAVRWVERKRRDAGCNPADGLPARVDEQAREVWRLHDEEGLPQRSIALRLGLSQGRVSQVLRGLNGHERREAA